MYQILIIVNIIQFKAFANFFCKGGNLSYYSKNENRELKVIEVEMLNSFYGKSSLLAWKGAIK